MQGWNYVLNVKKQGGIQWAPVFMGIRAATVSERFIILNLPNGRGSNEQLSTFSPLYHPLLMLDLARIQGILFIFKRVFTVFEFQLQWCTHKS